MKKYLLLASILLLAGCGEKEYYCDSGDELKGTSCIVKNETPAEPVYTCSRYYGKILNRSQCCDSKYTNLCYKAEIDYYTCSNGYLSGTKCIIETTYNAYEK